MTDTVFVLPERLRRIVEELFVRASVEPDNAALLADTIIEANMRGVDSHGIAALGIYLRRIRTGATNPRPRPRIIKEGVASVLIDGDNGLGAITARFAMEKAIARCQDTAVFLACCFNNTTFGAAFYYSKMAALEGKIGFALCNAPPSMAPWGGKKALLGTNPISVALPKRVGVPIVLDMATSAAAKSKIYLAKERGEPIPPGWALDKDGKPTTDPEEALKGLVMPLGGAKGYGLSLVVDLLCGGLSGGGCLDKVMSLHRSLDRGQNVSFALGAIDPQWFGGLSEFIAIVDEVVDKIHSCPVADGFDQIYLPGEIEERIRKVREREGIPVPRAVIEEIASEASYLGMEVDL